jgi:hypothetical protein
MGGGDGYTGVEGIEFTIIGNGLGTGPNDD